MKKLTFTVTVGFESKITDDNDIKEITHNIVKALVNGINDVGIAPQNSDTYTTSINVKNEMLDYEFHAQISAEF